MFLCKKTVGIVLIIINFTYSAFSSEAQSYVTGLNEIDDQLQRSTTEYKTLKSIVEPSNVKNMKDNYSENSILNEHYSNISSSYNTFIFNDPDNPLLKPLLDKVVSSLLKMSTDTIVDIGSGTCRWSSKIGQELKENIECIEPSVAMTRACSNLSWIKPVNINLENWLLNTSRVARRILLNQVLHHLSRQDRELLYKFIKETNSSMLIVTRPYTNSYPFPASVTAIYEKESLNINTITDEMMTKGLNVKTSYINIHISFNKPEWSNMLYQKFWSCCRNLTSEEILDYTSTLGEEVKFIDTLALLKISTSKKL